MLSKSFELNNILKNYKLKSSDLKSQYQNQNKTYKDLNLHEIIEDMNDKSYKIQTLLKLRDEILTPRFAVIIRLTINNTFVVLLDERTNRTIFYSSAGSIGLKGPKRPTVFAAEMVGREISKKLSLTKIQNVKIILRSPFNSRTKAALRGLCHYFTRFDAFIFGVPIAHNGIRKRKARRV